MIAPGVVFTPSAWARWAVERLNAPALVAAGATFCDPTAGEGAFVFALAEATVGLRGVPDAAWADRVWLIERDGAFLETFARRWREAWGFAFPERNLIETDVVLNPPKRQYDLVAGNPPWITYPDLSSQDQAAYRPWFQTLDLVGPPSQLLLGRSRLDLAALVTASVFTNLVSPRGRAGFFLPLSLFHNDGSAARWRSWRPDSVVDLTELRPFPGVATRCGWAEFTPGSPPAVGRPIPYLTGSPGRWEEQEAVEHTEGAPWRIIPKGTSAALPSCPLQTWQRPRQGINTGGANAAFHVVGPPPGVDPSFVHPLATARLRGTDAKKWILVPYHRNGSLLDENELEASGLAAFWSAWRERLSSRRGVLLGSQLSRGRWWALLGVGAYAFTPYKVVWSAYGRARLDASVLGPRSDGSVWQADQALQAYIPCLDEAEAQRLRDFLNSEPVADYLASLRGAGTKNWAQPGRFKPLWRFPQESCVQEGTTGN